MDFGAGLGEGGRDGDGALRASLRRSAEGLGLVLPGSDREWGRLAEYVDAGSGRRVMVYPPDGDAGPSGLRRLIRQAETGLDTLATQEREEIRQATAIQSCARPEPSSSACRPSDPPRATSDLDGNHEPTGAGRPAREGPRG